VTAVPRRLGGWCARLAQEEKGKKEGSMGATADHFKGAQQRGEKRRGGPALGHHAVRGGAWPDRWGGAGWRRPTVNRDR
jgi:hypothetical protein